MCSFAVKKKNQLKQITVMNWVDFKCIYIFLCVPYLFSNVELHKLLAYIHQLPPVEKEEECIPDADYLLELLISRHEKRKSQQERVNEMPLYPTEKIIWDENIVPVEYFSGEGKCKKIK